MSLDPEDWETFRRDARNVLDACIDHLASVARHPWQPVPPEHRDALALGDAAEGIGTGQLAHELLSKVLPFATGNTHPRFFGWVHGTGLASGLLAEIVAATMNSNCGGRDHGAVYVERAVIDWCVRCFGFPATASGVLVTGTSQATVIALATARTWALGGESRQSGIQVQGHRLRAYAVAGVHHAIVKALELLGLGAQSLSVIPADETGGMSISTLGAAIAHDRAAGWRPFCVVGTAGSVDLGRFDDLGALADVCAREGLWFHVDGAYGAWTRLAKSPWRELSAGIDRANSIAFDFHKWMFVQYECGAVLIRDERIHRATFAARPEYLAPQDGGLGGGEPWFCDYGIDLSRGFRALKVWSALRAHGSRSLGEVITRNCELAAFMAHLVTSTPELRLMAPVSANICCFDAAPSANSDDESSSINATIARNLQLSGDAVFSTTRLSGRMVLRAALTNHRTTQLDVSDALSAVLRELTRLAPHMRMRKQGS